MNPRAALILLLSLTAGACGKTEPTAAPPAVSAPPQAPPVLPSVLPEPPEAIEAPKPRPTVLVFVEGGPDARTLWRGWPVLVRAAFLEGDDTADLTVRGPSAIAPERRGKLWVVPAAASLRLAPGAYTFSVGAGSREVAVSDPPAALTPAQAAIRRRLSAHADLAMGDGAGALKAARDWVAAEPASIEARSVLGDALRATGDRAGAAAAYDEAIRRVPPGVRPPAGLHARAAELRRESLDALPGKPIVPEETEFYGHLEATAAALKAGNRAEAERAWSAADALHRDRKLTISRHELAGWRAALDAPPVAPKKPEVPKAESPTSPKAGAPAAGVVVPAAELNDEKVRAEAAGQWAATATAGSQYGSMAPYSAAKATGAPDVPVAGNSPAAWCPAGKNAGTDWLEAAFATPVHATEIRVRQNDAAGAIARIEAVEPDGTVHLWWEGVDPLAAGSREIVWFAVRVPKTPYLVAKVKVTLNLAAVPGWKEIDAVQLVGAP